MVDSRFTPNREPVAPYHLLDQDGTLHGTSPLTDSGCCANSGVSRRLPARARSTYCIIAASSA